MPPSMLQFWSMSLQSDVTCDLHPCLGFSEKGQIWLFSVSEWTGPQYWIWTCMSKTGTKSLSLEIGECSGFHHVHIKDQFCWRAFPHVEEILIWQLNKAISMSLVQRLHQLIFSLCVKQHSRAFLRKLMNEWFYSMCWQSELSGPNPNKYMTLDQKVKLRFSTRGSKVKM